MDELSDEQRLLVAGYWWSRAEGELTSWVGFQHVLADLRAEGSPAPVLELAERSVADEYQHFEFCQEWARRFGHAAAPEIQPRDTRPLTFRGASERENRLLRIALCCFTESVGCFILQHVRPLLTQPELRKLNQRHLADELRHSRVGWGHLATLNAEQRALLGAWLPRLFSVLERVSCQGTEQERPELLPFGYFTPSLLRAAHDAAVREVIAPGVLHLGIGNGTSGAGVAIG